MPHTSSPPVFTSFASSAELVDALADFILKTQKEALDKKGRFAIALSGGSLPKQLGGLIGKPGIRWEKWYGSGADTLIVVGC
jgi:6-phosphogluconolactonase